MDIVVRIIAIGGMDGLGLGIRTFAALSRLGLGLVIRDGDRDSVRVKGATAVLGGMVRTTIF